MLDVLLDAVVRVAKMFMAGRKVSLGLYILSHVD